MKWPTYYSLPSLSAQYLRSLLRACARQPSFATGKILHAIILTSGHSSVPFTFLLNTLLHVYTACGATSYARKVFDEIPHSNKDTVDWTALIACLARQPTPLDAISLFAKMRKENVEIDQVTMTCLLSLSARLRDLRVGVQGHTCMMKMGLGFNVKTCNALMDMYGKCGLLNEARRVFTEMKTRSVVSWTVILDGVVKWEGAEKGRLLFDEMPESNEVAWTIMIVGYVGSGYIHEGFSLLSEMVISFGLELNYVTLCSILSACAQSGDVMMGRWVHVYAMKAMGKEINVMVGTALVDMYAKCGRIDMALKVFEYMPLKNVVAWNAMLSGLAMHGRGKVVLDMFSKMNLEVKPDDLTFMAVLSGCSHSGLVDQGWQYFSTLESLFGLTPKVEHYACMVDLLGRVGCLEDAENLIKTMPIPPNEVVLGSLLGSCNVHGKLQLGERVLQELIQMDPHNTEYHVLLSNMYVVAGKHNKANSLRQVLKNKGVRKVPGISSIHVGGKVHQFSARDKSHPQTREIYRKLDEMIRRLRLAGYTPNTASQVFSDCYGREDKSEEMEEKEHALFLHSEKLAVCFGLISTRPGAPLYIFKNIRICQDCHSAIKIVSEIYNREIIVRDRNRFHCFNRGSCSCSDFW